MYKDMKGRTIVMLPPMKKLANHMMKRFRFAIL
jgi:hypothetical protein